MESHGTLLSFKGGESVSDSCRICAIVNMAGALWIWLVLCSWLVLYNLPAPLGSPSCRVIRRGGTCITTIDAISELLMETQEQAAEGDTHMRAHMQSLGRIGCMKTVICI